jgi:hypothetical protein
LEEIFDIVFLWPTGAVLGIFEGLYKCIFSYFKGLTYSFKRSYSMRAKIESEDSAKEHYFFYKQYEDLRNTYKSAKAINNGNNLLLRKRVKEEDSFTLARIKTAQTVINTVGTLLIMFCFSIHFLIITVISVPIYLFYFLVISIEKIRFARKHIWVICPHCHHKFKIPNYICPDCGRIHKKLVPGPYGIIKRRCKCGTLLPSTNFIGRFRLKAVCPHCSEIIESGESSPVCISIIGAKGSGKTYFMYSIFNTLINCISKEKNWNMRFVNKDEEERFNKALDLFKKGNLLECSNKSIGYTNNIFISSDKFSSEKLLYIYDLPGESFELRANIRRQSYYKHIDGLIFIIDAMSLESSKEKYAFKNVSSTDVNVGDLIDRFILSLREIREISLDKLIDIPLAVIVNKVNKGSYKGDAIDFLREMEEEKIIRKFEHNFSNYKFFLCSMLQNVTQEDNDKSREIEEPLQWILINANKELKI